MTEETIFAEAVAKTDVAQRAAYLDAACAGDAELRQRLDALLKAHDESAGFLDAPAAPPRHDATGDYTPEPGGDPGHVPTSDYQPPTEAGAVIAGRYTLVEKIGEGGMGEVWVAKQTEPVKRKVALKLIKAGMDSKAVLQRFEAERQALAMMDHPNIAKVLDGGVVGQDSNPVRAPTDRIGILSHNAGRPFFVMELVNGLPLTKFCDDAKLGIRERLDLFVTICQAVQHAHQKGIVHRDLKPSNILVTLMDGKPIPKVIDFGVAKATGGKLTDESLSTQFGAVIGTLEYMSPEQAGFSAADVDTRADIYSLGVILYELLTGLRPFDGNRLRKAALDEMIRIIREEEPSKPSTRLSTDESSPSLAAVRQTEPGRLAKLLRGELDWVVMKCLEKQRDRRYETASGLARDIQRYLADEPVEARPPTAKYRLGKFLRRNKGPVITTGLVAAALLVGTSVAIWQAVVATRAETKARDAEDQAKKDRDKALEAEAVAVSQTDLSYDALGDLVLKIQMDLDETPGGRHLRKELLEDTMKKLHRLLDSPATSDRLLRRHGLAHYQLGEILWGLNRKAEAEKEYLLAGEFAEKALRNNPASDKAKVNVAAHFNRMGDVEWFYKGNFDPAQERYKAALSLWEDLAKKLVAFPDGDPTLPEVERVSLNDVEEGLADTCDRRGIIRMRLGESAAPAIEWFDKALAIRMRHLDMAPTYAHRAALCSSYAQISYATLLNPNMIRNLLEHREILFQERPWSLRARRDLSDAHMELGHSLQLRRQDEESQRHFQDALRLRKQILAAEPDDPLFQGLAAYAHYMSGTAFMRLNKPKEALQDFQESLKLRQAVYDATNDSRQKLNLQPILMLALARCGKHAEAAELAPAVRQLPSKQNDHLREVGSCYGLCMVSVGAGKPPEQLTPEEKFLRQRYLLKALATFDEGRARGWMDLPFFLSPYADAEPWVRTPEFKPWLDSFQEWRRLPGMGSGKYVPKSESEYRAALERQRQRVAQHPEIMQLRRDLVQLQCLLVVALMRAGKQAEADTELKAAATVQSQTTAAIPGGRLEPVQEIVAGLLSRVRDLAAELTAAEKEVQLNPKSAKAHLDFGRAQLELDKFDDAAASFREVLRLDPNVAAAKRYLTTAEVQIHLRIGQARLEAGNFDGAAASFRQVLRLDPNREDAKRSLATAEQAQKLARLADVLAGRAELTTPAEGVELARFCADSSRKRVADAIRLYDKAIAAVAADPKLANDLAWLLATCPDAKIRDPQRATDLATKAVELAPMSDYPWNTLGVARYRAGDWKASIAALEKSRELSKGGSSFDFFFLAMARWQLGDKQAAHKWYDQGVAWMNKNQPKDEELKRFCAEAVELLGVKKSK